MGSRAIAAWIILFAACGGSAAPADDVRHSAVPEAARGTWAAGTDLCGDKAKTVTLSANQYSDEKNTCEVRWVQERAATPGTIYSAHMLCRAAGQSTGSTRPTDLVVWIKGNGQVSIGPALNALVANVRCG